MFPLLRKLAAAALLAAGFPLAAQALGPAPDAVKAGRFEQAITTLDAQLAAATGAGRIAPLYWRAQAQGALGMRAGAVHDLEDALAEAGRARATAPVVAAISIALGAQLTQAGALERARPHVERALTLAAGAPALEAAALDAEANLLRREGKAAQAEPVALRALDLAERASAHDVAAAAAIALLAARRGGIDGASLARRGALAAGAMPDSHDKAYRLIALAQLAAAPDSALRAEFLPQASAWLAQAAQIATQVGDPRALSYANGELGRLYEDAGRTEEALALTQRAVLAAQRANAPEALYRWQWRTARLQRKLGYDEAALAAYRRAVATLASIRQDLIVELRASGQSYRDTVGPLFVEQADLLLRRARTLSGAEAQRDLVQARDAIESLKAVELEDYFQDECVAGLQAKQKSLEEIAARTAILYPVILPDRVVMLVTVSSGLRQVELPVSGAQLAGEALAMRQLLEKRSTHQYLPHAQRLYDWLLRPLEPLLAAENADTLVLVPDGPLRQVPIAALHDGKRFLVERYAIAIAPALRLIEPRALSRQAPRVLLNGLSLSVQKFPALPYVTGEVSAINGMMPATVLTDQSFVLANFEKEMRGVNYSVVHIASHGQFDSDPKKSFLLAYDGRLDMDALERVMKLSRFRDEPVELLTLSACRTAAGDERAALGLAGVAIKAGARSALATLWYINDQASSALVEEFYRDLQKPGTSKARALQEAQLFLLADPRYRHPGFWSPFLLIGNWL